MLKVLHIQRSENNVEAMDMEGEGDGIRRRGRWKAKAKEVEGNGDVRRSGKKDNLQVKGVAGRKVKSPPRREGP